MFFFIMKKPKICREIAASQALKCLWGENAFIKDTYQQLVFSHM